MKESTINEILNLFESGNTSEEIAEELALDITEVEEVLESFEFEVEEEIPTLSGLEKNNELRERELNLEEKKLFVKAQKQKRSILKSFKALCEGIWDTVQGSVWNHGSITKTLSEVEDSLEELEDVFEFDKEAMKDNSIFEILKVLKHEFSTYAKFDPDYSSKLTIDWAVEKLNMLQFGLQLESFDDSDFDTEDYQRQRAYGVYKRFIETVETLEGRKIDEDKLSALKGELSHVRETISQDVPGIKDEFEDELATLTNIETYLNELEIRIDESLWGEKRFSMPSESIVVTEEDD